MYRQSVPSLKKIVRVFLILADLRILEIIIKIIVIKMGIGININL